MAIHWHLGSPAPQLAGLGAQSRHQALRRLAEQPCRPSRVVDVTANYNSASEKTQYEEVVDKHVTFLFSATWASSESDNLQLGFADVPTPRGTGHSNEASAVLFPKKTRDESSPCYFLRSDISRRLSFCTCSYMCCGPQRTNAAPVQVTCQLYKTRRRSLAISLAQCEAVFAKVDHGYMNGLSVVNAPRRE
ncbi:hypothetical protein Micbo1qcDRAFT_211407 [Microdochium bolleyi]|uniref:Uncharacterized protein n=1 Tax=Microdochium bolleyi TaxID=196109 RepID=A0A136JJ21_9PEZI|nr:hypothetical protein Micbo1qcDRAFT_211407 [Microdochium bolleyi]